MPLVIDVSLNQTSADRALSDLESRASKTGAAMATSLNKGTEALEGLKEAGDEAQKAAKGLGDAVTKLKGKGFDDLGDSAEEAARQLEAAKKSAEGLGSTAGKTGSNAGKLAGALGMISPEAGGAINALKGLADVTEVASAASAAMGVTVGSLALALAPIALVVGALAYAWHDYSEKTKEAKEWQEKLNTAIDGVDGLTADARNEILDLKHTIGKLTDEQYDNQKIEAQWAAKLKASTAALNEEKAALQEKVLAIGVQNDETAKLQGRIEELNGFIERATTLAWQGTEAAKKNAEIARERAESEKTLADRAQARAEAERRAAKATQDNNKATAEAAKAEALAAAAAKAHVVALEKAEQVAQKAVGSLSKMGQTAADATANAAGTAADAVELAYQRQVEAATAAARAALRTDELTAEQREAIAQALAQTLADLEAGRAAAAEKANADIIAAEREANAQRQQQTASLISSAQGGLAAIAGAIAGPVAGAIVGMVLNLEDTVTKLKEELRSLPNVLENAPALISDLLQTLMVEVIPALIDHLPAIGEALAMTITSPEFLLAVAKLSLLIFDPTLAYRVAVQMAKGFVKALGEGWKALLNGEIFKNLGKIFDAIFQQFFGSIARFFRDLVQEILTLGKANTSLDMRSGEDTAQMNTANSAIDAIANDTPGVVQAPPGGQTMKVGGQDYVATSRTRDGLIKQALAGVLVGGSGMAPTVNLSDGGVTFARQVRRVVTARQVRGALVAQQKNGRI